MSANNSVAKDLTFLFQGKFTEETNLSIRKVRKLFPNSQIVISCWEGDDKLISEEVDKCVLNIDPVVYAVSKYKLDNINRQIVSTKSGLNNINTNYVCKLRTDSYLDNAEIIGLFNKYKSIANKGVFRERVIVTNLTTINPMKKKHSFHVCDWVYFGLTTDVKRIFSLDIKPQEYFHYFEGQEYLDDSICSQHRAETALFEHVFSKDYVAYKDTYDTNSVTIDLTLSLFKNDLIIVNPWMIGLKSFKHKHTWLWINSTRFTFNDWLVLIGHKKNYAEWFKECCSIAFSYLLSKAILVKNRVNGK